MGARSRGPADILFELLEEISHKKKTSKWDLEKIVGTVAQFERYVTNFLLKYKFVEETREERTTYYKKTTDGELFHETLYKKNIILAYRRISGRRLKRETYVDRHDLDWNYRLGKSHSTTNLLIIAFLGMRRQTVRSSRMSQSGTSTKYYVIHY